MTAQTAAGSRVAATLSPALATTLAGIPLSAPVLAASGCAGSGRELARFSDLRSFGAVVTRSIAPEPRAGGPLPRLVESPSGLVNAIGLPGPGAAAFVAEELPWLVSAGAVVIASIWAERPSDYAKVAQQLRQIEGVAAVEVNLSHPGGRRPALTDDASAAAGVVHQVRRNTAAGTPVFAKLAGDGGDVVGVARSVAAAGADGVTLINAVRAMALDTARTAPALGAGFGGLSGPAIRPIALRAVWEVHAALPRLPIIGCGGIASGADALEMILAGASAVALGTVLLHDPAAGGRVAAELAQLVSGRGATVPQLVGAAHGSADA